MEAGVDSCVCVRARMFKKTLLMQKHALAVQIMLDLAFLSPKLVNSNVCVSPPPLSEPGSLSAKHTRKPVATIRGVVVVERGVDVLSVADGAPGVCSGCSLVSRPDVNTIGVFNQVSRTPERERSRSCKAPHIKRAA